MAYAAWIGCAIDAGTPTGLAGAAAGGDVEVFAMSEGGRFLDGDEVVFEAQVSIDVAFVLVMAEDDARTVLEAKGVFRGREEVGKFRENTAAEVFEVFEIGFAYFAQEEAFEAGDALAIVGADLSEKPMGLAAATRAAEGDGSGTAGLVALARGGGGSELFRLEEDHGAGEVDDLVAGAVGELSFV